MSAENSRSGPAGRSPRVVIAIVTVVLLAMAGTVWALVRDPRGGDDATSPSATGAVETTVAGEPTSEPEETGPSEPTTTSPGATDPATDQTTDQTTEPAEPRDVPDTLEERPPVELDEEVVAAGLTVAISALEAVDGTGTVAGEVAGPAVRFTVTVTNGTDGPIDLSTAVVNVTYGPDRSPGGELSGPGVDRLPATVAAGATQTGVYVFGVPLEERGRIQVMVDLAAGEPIIVFEGAGPG